LQDKENENGSCRARVRVEGDAETAENLGGTGKPIKILGSAFVPAHMTIALRKPRTLQQLSKYS